MTFTPLEATLITFCTSLIVGLVVSKIAGKDKVTCDACDKRHQALDETIAAGADKDKKDHGMILRMLRSIVLNLNIPAEKKEDILNDR